MTTIEDLRLSGLSQETISLMGIESVSAEEATDLLGSRQSYPNGGYKIPYRNVAGNLTKFFRIRFLPALKNSKGKDQKYAQKKGDSNHLYIPPNIDREALLNPDIPIIITEGEKKSAKACQESYLCVELGGVDN